MIRISQIRLPAGHSPGELEQKIKKILKSNSQQNLSYTIHKRSLDARKKPQLFYEYCVDIEGADEERLLKGKDRSRIMRVEPSGYCFPGGGSTGLTHRPVIAGMGPAGLFCAYMLALHGFQPIIWERGEAVEERLRTVEEFWNGKPLNPESNVQFGEGGAGTFSDGKLNTLIKDKTGRCREVLSILVREGAPEEILYDSKPHIGTDILVRVVTNMRKTILEHGGSIYYNTKLTGLETEGGALKRIFSNQLKLDTQVLILAPGHSARDTFQMLYDAGLPMEAKAFAAGFRVEHKQCLIDQSQYGEQSVSLPPAAYKLTAQTKEGRGVYTFCMCPGGYVVDASSEEGHLAVNGMSYSKRDGQNANSAVIVTVTPEDFKTKHPLSGIEFQRELEKRAYEAGEGKVPVQTYGAFKSKVLGDLQEETGEAVKPCIKGKWQSADLTGIFPDKINRAWIEGMEAFGRKIKGFASADVTVSGVESRTSSPVRILRDELGQSGIRGIYPCGEGAGYAGGITSAAMDGLRAAELIAAEYRKFSEEEGHES